MNIIINDTDHPLIIKVASLPSARIQVYFIDNDDYFQRKHIVSDASGKEFEDNDERAIFFARGVLETVKKLRWKPDIIHCQGWISHFVPIYIKKVYMDDPIFADSKIVVSLYNEGTWQVFNDDTRSKVLVPGIKNRDMEVLNPANGINLAKLAIQYSDGVILGDENIEKELIDSAVKYNLPALGYINALSENSNYVEEYVQFYDKILAKK